MARPDLSYLKNLILGVTGLVCGVLTGLTVVAGSIVSTELVRYLLGRSRASSTALATTFFGSLAAVYSYHQHNKVHWGVGILLAITQIIGVSWADRRSIALRTNKTLRLLWAAIGVASGFAIMIYAHQIDHIAHVPWSYPILHTFFGWIGLVVVAGFVVGAVSQVMNLGGVLLIPACLLLLHIDPLGAQGTALVGLLFVSMSGMLIYAKAGEYEPQSVMGMSFGAVFGGLVGAYFAVRLHPQILVSLFGLILTATAIGRYMSGAGLPPPTDEVAPVQQ